MPGATPVAARDRAIFRTHNIRKEFAPMGITARIENLHTATAVMESWPGYVLSDTRKQAVRIRTPLISARNFAAFIRGGASTICSRRGLDVRPDK